MADGGRKNMNKYNPPKGRLNDDSTQPVDTQISPESFPGNGHEGCHDQRMGPADDQLFFNDAFETKLANLSGENQIFDIGGETQVVDFSGDTQVVDFGSEAQQIDLGGETQVVDDLDGPLNKPIEVVIDSDSEGSDRTEVLCDTREVLDQMTIPAQVIGVRLHNRMF